MPVLERFIDFLEQINSLSYKEMEEMAKVKAGIAIQEEEVKNMNEILDRCNYEAFTAI